MVLFQIDTLLSYLKKVKAFPTHWTMLENDNPQIAIFVENVFKILTISMSHSLDGCTYEIWLVLRGFIYDEKSQNCELWFYIYIYVCIIINSYKGGLQVEILHHGDSSWKPVLWCHISRLICGIKTLKYLVHLADCPDLHIS